MTPEQEMREILAAVKAALGWDLAPDSVEWIDGWPTIDGMDPYEWIGAMTMED